MDASGATGFRATALWLCALCSCGYYNATTHVASSFLRPGAGSTEKGPWLRLFMVSDMTRLICHLSFGASQNSDVDYVLNTNTAVSANFHGLRTPTDFVAA